MAWLGGATVLKGGHGGTFPPANDAEADLAVDAGPVSTPPLASAMASAAPAATPLRAPTGGGWRDYARAGDYAKAYDDLRARGSEAVQDDAADLLLAADTARLSGHPEEAVPPLRALCDRHSRDRNAPVAAFTLGRVLLDDMGRPSESAIAFRRAFTLWPSGPLAEDALAREAEAWERAGRMQDARGAAEKYLSRYPLGRHAADMKNILSE